MSGIENSNSSNSEELKIRSEAWKLAFESPDDVFETLIQEAALENGEINDMRNARSSLHPDSIHNFGSDGLFASRALFGMHDIEKEGKPSGPLERRTATFAATQRARECAPGLRKIENLLRNKKRDGTE